MDTYTYYGRRRAEKKTLRLEKGVWEMNTSIPIDIFVITIMSFCSPAEFGLEILL